MATVTLRDAKAKLSSLVGDAMNGEFVTITRHGKPVAAIVPMEAAEAAKMARDKARANLGAYIMSFPGGLETGSEIERNPSPMRDIDL